MLLLPALLFCAAQDPLARVHDALFLRTAPDGKTCGAGELEPLLYPSSDWLLKPQQQKPLLEALDALHAADLSARPVREKLVLQRDLWMVFDWVFEHEPQGSLAAALARALHDLRCSAEELRGVHTDGTGLPEGLLDASHGFVRLTDELGRTITPAHERHTDGRSRFEVLLRLPGGREATLAWLERLHALPDPLQGQGEEQRFRADLPPLPAGTEVALVRRALAIDEHDGLVATDLVESVQERRFTSPSEQTVAEFRLDRGGAHDLRAFGPDEYDFSSFGTHGEDPFEDERAWGWKKPGLVRCVGCHAQPGIYSVNSFTRMATGPGTILSIRPGARPSVLVEADRSKLESAAVEFKRGRDSWKALKARWSAAPR